MSSWKKPDPPCKSLAWIKPMVQLFISSWKSHKKGGPCYPSASWNSKLMYCQHHLSTTYKLGLALSLGSNVKPTQSASATRCQLSFVSRSWLMLLVSTVYENKGSFALIVSPSIGILLALGETHLRSSIDLTAALTTSLPYPLLRCASSVHSMPIDPSK